jgi:hypothetical protein
VTAIFDYLEHAAPAAERTTVKTSLHFKAISEGPIYGTDRKHDSTLTRGSIKTAPDCAFSLRRLFHGWLQIGKLSHEFITRPGVESWNFKSWEGAGTSYRSTGNRY